MEKEVKIELKATSNPLFADEVIVGTIIKGAKTKEGEMEKDGYIRLGFIDMAKRQVFAEIVLSPITAKALVKILDENLKKLENELKSKELPKAPMEVAKTEELTYIG
jgi:hypothetical protein